MRVIAIEQPRVEEFINLAWRINADDPRWIPPIRASLHQELTAADAFGRYGRLRLFGCESDGRLVGRLAAIVNPRLVDSTGHPVGQVGYFEAADDAQIAANLFGAAFDWLKSNGAREVLGPMNGGAHRLHRLMTVGFDREPFLFEPRNPPYYPRLFESGGFTRHRVWYSHDASSETYARALATLNMLQIPDVGTRRYQLVELDPSDAVGVLPRMHALLDRLWLGHVGYASLDLPEFADIFAPALSIMNRGDLVALTDRATGVDVGFAFGYPDFGAEVRALNGDASRWGSWRPGGARPRRLVMHTVAVVPEARRTGGSQMLIRRIFGHAVEAGYENGVMALVTEEFKALRRVAPPTREHVLFARPLD